MFGKVARIPEPNEELRKLEPLIPVLFEAFEGATESACAFFEGEEKPINAALHPCLVRYYARDFLQDKCQVVEEFEREEIANNGLCLAYRGRRYRIWKAEDERLPAPGPSGVKQAFLNQQLSMFLPEHGEARPVDLNLVILWNVDQQHRLTGLHLVCPKWASSDGLTAEAHWACPIEHPAAGMAGVPSEPRPTEPDGYKDLPIEIRETDARDIEQAE